MPGLLQPSFAGGEISPGLGGRFDTELYKKALRYCNNFKIRPVGSLLKRAGTRRVDGWAEDDAPRLFQFRRTGIADDVIVAVGPSKIRAYDRLNGLLSFGVNLLTNGSFNADLASWAAGYYVSGVGWVGEAAAVWDNGTMRFGPFARAATHMTQDVATTNGHVYRVSIKAKKIGNPTPTASIRVGIGNWFNASGGTPQGGAFVLGDDWQTFTFTFMGDGTAMHFTISAGQDAILGPYASGVYAYVDDVVVSDTNAAPVSSWNSPWSLSQIDDVQAGAAPVSNQLVFVHGNVQPWNFYEPTPGVLDFAAAVFASKPASWTGTNWPAAIELGFQGRMFLANTPASPTTLWGSKSGSIFDFTIGSNPADAMSFIVSSKGRLNWLQGHKVLLSGSEVVEHVITSSTGLVMPGDISVRDESSFGSAPVQSRHIGDQVLFVSPDRRKLRSLNYYFQENGWITRALTFVADHLTSSGIREVHYAQSPDPTIFCVLRDGTLIACTYDRSEQVLAWWRVDVGAWVRSAAVANGVDGAELWLSLVRDDAVSIERLPLHEVGISYLDSSVAGYPLVVSGLPSGDIYQMNGLTHLAGKTVAVFVDGVRIEDKVVVGSGFDLGLVADYAAPPFVEAGLLYTATARTMPKNSQDGRVRQAKIGVILNDSALPLVNGRRAPERNPSTPMDTVEGRVTGKRKVANALGWDDEGCITIEQDLPLRTEILAIYEATQVGEVDG
jgi:hypothetical protein